MRRAGGGWLRLRHGDSRSLDPTNWEMAETRAENMSSLMLMHTQSEDTMPRVTRHGQEVNDKIHTFC